MKPRRKILKNGLRIITIPMKDNPTVTALVMVEAGSKYETKKTNGLSHFLEHMCFQGTENRPTPGQVSYELEQIGAEHNAFTGEEYTGYYAKAQKKYAGKIVELIGDLYLNPIFPEDAIEREKGVIIEEINMYEDLPQVRVMEYLTELLYGDQPAGWRILGPKENIQKFKRGDFVRYRDRHYVPQATTVVVAGGISSQKIHGQIQKLFLPLTRSKKTGKKKVTERQKEPKAKVVYKKTDQAHFALGIRAFDVYDKDAKVLKIISYVLGQGLSSRLFQRMRNELGMCYYTRAEAELLTDHGIFVVRAGVSVPRTQEAVEVVLGELKRLIHEPVPAEELKKAKDLLIGGMFMGIESSDAVAQYYAGQEILKKDLKTPAQKAREYRSVTARDIQRVAKKIFKNKNLNLALVGPFKGTKSFEHILKL